MKTKVLVSTGNDINKFTAAIEEYFFGTKVDLKNGSMMVTRKSDGKILYPYRLKAGRLQMYKEIDNG